MPGAYGLLLFLTAIASLGHHGGQRYILASAYETSRISVPTDLCESRTVNYITHTLPQQCLRTAWSSANATVAGNGTISASIANATAVGDASTDGKDTEVKPTNEGKVEDGQKGKEEDKTSEELAAEEDNQDLATGAFMSFEEWKAIQLQKAGQDPAVLAARKKQENRGEAYQGSTNGDLDSLGDDGEIALEFDALSEKVSEIASSAGSATGEAQSKKQADVVPREEAVLYDDGKTQYARSKDAGKTCKERFSYSSFDAGATVLKTSPGAKNPKALLAENRDSYMLLDCNTPNKFIIVELSEDILVDTVVLANYEFFSSMIRRFRVSVSDRYPVKIDKWKELGTFEARNSRDIQPFLIEHPQIWTKYIRVEFLSHYGNEYYCPLSLLRVHGTRMLDSWKESEGGHDDDEETIDPPPEQATQLVEVPEAEETEIIPIEKLADQSLAQMPGVGSSPWHPPFFQSEACLDTCATSSPTASARSNATQVEDGVAASPSTIGAQASSTTAPASPSSATESRNGASSASGTNITSTLSQPTVLAANASLAESSQSIYQSNSTSQSQADSSSQTSASSAKNSSTSAGESHTTKPTIPKSPISKPPSAKSSSTTPAPKSSTSHQAATGSTKQNRTNPSAPPPIASPTVQESFFKTVTKRLQLLESNTSLSLQYIEDQSRFLQEALKKMERKQISRVDSFLDTLNKTVLSELRNVRTQYDQIWQSTVIALESQREQSQREILALSERLSVLGDEVVFQKRMAILQSVLLLSCLILVIFSRGLVGSSMDLALLNSATTGASAAASPSTATIVPTSPSPSAEPIANGGYSNPPTPSPLRNGSKGGIGRPRGLSRSLSYPEKGLPLTPTSEYGREEPTPPSILIEEADSSYFDDMVSYTPSRRSKLGEEIIGVEICGGSSRSVDTLAEEIPGMDVTPSSSSEELSREKPKSTPGWISASHAGSGRKPLPALPEDPT